MSQNQVLILVVVIVIAVIAVAAIAFVTARKRRSAKLRDRFGPEYDRVLQHEGDTRKAEGVLEFREKRREKFTIHPLSEADKSSFAVRWNEVQSRFVDDPRGSVTVADSLVTEVMQKRGYPIGEFEQRAADISVDHPVVVENYRAAHGIALRHSSGQASTEDLRQAMVHYRALFQELLDERQPQREPIPQRKGA
jgi:FtsZ-interacting cell division protein ZipA